jgi:hypothetical protein
MVNIVLVDHLNLDTGILKLITTVIVIEWFSGADPGFKVRGAHLKKLRRAEGGAKNFGVFRVKITILRQKILFFPILGGGWAPPPPHPGSDPGFDLKNVF